MNNSRYLAAVVLLLSVGNADAKVRTPSATDRLQAACYSDVQRLCRDAIPDAGRVRACMKGKASMVSSRCKKAYKAIHG